MTLNLAEPIETTQEIAEWASYGCHKVVKAALITSVHLVPVDGPEEDRSCAMVAPEIPIFDPNWEGYKDPRTERFTPNMPAMLKTARPGDVAVLYDNDYRSISPRREFLAGYHPYKGRPKLLMTADNPHGWKLEDLIAELQLELEEKSQALLARDKSQLARTIAVHNRQIARLLERPRLIQHATLGVLASLGMDQGPKGQPRV